MNRVAIDLGIIKIYWYSVFILLGIIIGTIIIYKEAKRQNIDTQLFNNLLFYTIICAIIGARMYYVLFNLDYYSKAPLEIFAIWNGGLAIHGGIFAGIAFLIYYSKKHHLNFLKLLDIIAVGLIVGQAIGRWGNFFNQEAYGQITTPNALSKIGVPSFIIDGMYIDGAYRQPTFLYESLWNMIGFILLLCIRKRKNLKVGVLTGSYFMWYSSARFIIEEMRTDSLMLGNFRMAQMVSLLLFILGFYLVFIHNKNTKKQNYYEEEKK